MPYSYDFSVSYDIAYQVKFTYSLCLHERGLRLLAGSWKCYSRS